MELLTNASLSDAVSEREKHNSDVAYRAACESIVLLKNDKALPFKGKKIAVFGPGAAHTVKGGTGSGEVNERHSVSILEALEQRDFEITTRKWLEDYEEQYEKKLEKFKKGGVSFDPLHPGSAINLMLQNFQLPAGRAVSKQDIVESVTENCIYVVSRQAGEGGDRKLKKGDYYLTDAEIKDIKFCSEQYKHFVLVINCGSPIDLGFSEKLKGLRGILHISQLGSRGGDAVADVLSGAVTPSGKLADTWAKNYEDIPFAREYSYLNGELENEYYKEGIYVGYRYFDSFNVEPRYPFGYGLSYAKFKLGRAKLSLSGTEAALEVSVKNRCCRYSGRETVQVYVSAPEGGMDKEYQRLVGYQKTGLIAPHRSETVSVKFDLARLASYRSEDASFVLEKGDYTVRVGTSSRDTVIAAVLRLDREVIVSKHVHVCSMTESFEELKAGPRPTENLSGVPVLTVDADAFETRVFTYANSYGANGEKLRRFVEGLSVSEMTDIVVGAGMTAVGRFQLPGSVGNTSSKFWDRGLVNATLCDGPAGLRISRRVSADENGVIKPLEAVMGFQDRLPGFVKKKMLGDENSDTVMYQYATAFPVESALAQTWNSQLLYEIGCALHEEMKEYGCVWWLAPAVNIHRNPLCGRNFEYFSEDPFLAGSLAAAVTKGVQKEEGYYVTVKHFACNNQEDNRNKVSSNVSERALREIYLTAFELAVREGGAKSIMTSYNRVNGVYAPNSYDLCTRVLRNEWGFEGVVMTDWFSTIPIKNGAALAIKAGNDMIMPGEPAARSSITRAIRNGSLTKEELRRACSNIVKAIMDSDIQKKYIQ